MSKVRQRVVHSDGFILLLVGPYASAAAVGSLIPSLQAGDLAGIFGRLPLSIVEVRRNGDDHFGHFLAE